MYHWFFETRWPVITPYSGASVFFISWVCQADTVLSSHSSPSLCLAIYIRKIYANHNKVAEQTEKQNKTPANVSKTLESAIFLTLN